MKIFIVEDDENILQMESYALSNSGFETATFTCGADLTRALLNELPDMVILDIMLPGEDGISILKRLRTDPKTKNIPVMMVTAKGTEIDKVKGLDAGADDYISKPFGILEFISRAKALLRRAAPKNRSNVLSYKEIVLNDETHEVTVNSKNIELTYKEFELLKYFIINKNIVLSRDKITQHVWGFDFEGESRTVDMHVKTLRKKLGECGDHIKTVRNVGYKLGE